MIQKPYLEGFLHKSLLEPFLDIIRPDIYLQYSVQYPDLTSETNINWDIQLQNGTKIACLTHSRGQECYTSKISNDSYDPPIDAFKIGFNSNILNMLKRECVNIFISLREFCNVEGTPVVCSNFDFYDKILSALERSSNQRSNREQPEPQQPRSQGTRSQQPRSQGTRTQQPRSQGTRSRRKSKSFPRKRSLVNSEIKYLKKMIR